MTLRENWATVGNSRKMTKLDTFFCNCTPQRVKNFQFIRKLPTNHTIEMNSLANSCTSGF